MMPMTHPALAQGLPGISPYDHPAIPQQLPGV